MDRSPLPSPSSLHSLPEPVAGMIAFAEEAGACALACRAAGLAVSHKGADRAQALTNADLAISRLLHTRFGPRLIEEETAEGIGYGRARALLAEAAWSFVGDPIDGTKPFAGGLPGWGTMVAACRHGWPEASVAHLPAWRDDRTGPPVAHAAEDAEGLLIAAWDGAAWWAPTRGGRRSAPLRPLPRPEARTHHVGWLPIAAQRYTIDYAQGLFPWGESAAIADAALVATGRLDATLSNHKLWDLAPLLPILSACGFDLYRWPDLAGPPPALIDIFDASFAAHEDLWLVCRDRAQAERLARAIRRA